MKLHHYHSERRFLQQQSVDDGYNATDIIVSKEIKRSEQKKYQMLVNILEFCLLILNARTYLRSTK